MRKLIISIIVLHICCLGVNAMEFTAPAPPESAEIYFPEEAESFGQGLWKIIRSAVGHLQPSVADASAVCLSLIAVTLLISMLQGISGASKRIVELVGVITIGILLIKPSNTLIQLAIQTVTELSEYGKLLVPVLTAALAAQGGATSSAALYTGTLLFNALLTAGISKILIPMVYIYMALCVSTHAIGEEMLKNLRDFAKWLMTWVLKIIIYVFTGYIGITGVVSGTADASAIKAAKLAISGFVPVVGNIISDASEAILVSAGVMKSAAGIYGLLAILSVCVGPFLQIGVLYLLLKVTAAACGAFGCKSTFGLIHDISGVMGFLVAIIGTVCLLLLISTVCFMKGVT